MRETASIFIRLAVPVCKRPSGVYMLPADIFTEDESGEVFWTLTSLFYLISSASPSHLCVTVL